MIYPHQQKAIDYITNKFSSEPQVDALLLSGSIAHGFNDEKSDIDIHIVVSNEVFEKKQAEHLVTYWEDASAFYEGGYFDGKYITLDYLSLVALRGNEPTKFALHDSKICFDRSGKVLDHLNKIGTYDTKGIKEKSIRFVSQFDAWKWYCDEAIKKQNVYLLDFSVSKLILFGGRLILLDNQVFFPYHKWLLRALENVENKPQELMPAIEKVLSDKTPDNIATLYHLVKNHKDWSGGTLYSWPSHFVHDVEQVWIRENDSIDNI